MNRKSLFSLPRGQQHWLHIFLVWVMLVAAIIACGAGTTAENVRIRDLPQFICATSTPLPTHTQPPTQVQPPIYNTPSGYQTYTPVPGCNWNGSVCATNTPYPGGNYSTPGYYNPGATSTPRPTYTPWLTPTPYVLTGRFFFGADVYTGGFESEISLRLRVGDVQVYPLDNTRQVTAWTVQLENVGQVAYATIPGGQVFVAEVITPNGSRSGQWWASAEAAQAAGITLQPEVLDVLEVLPGQVYTLTLTAFTPIGEPLRVGWILDPLADGRDGDLVGGNLAYWASDVSAECTHNPGSDVNIPTPSAPAPTPTPSHTPQYPSWCTWCGQ
ncbi:MAG: hypothetical protein K8L97_22100 [Anaerolineae bacterium]|nr:hypothetical protein [Anaerolineae bacterium]